MLARLIFLLFTLIPTLLAAQSMHADTLQLPTLDVAAPAIRRKPIGAVTQAWSYDEWRHGAPASVAQLLQQSTGIYIKTHGLGQLATASSRGSAASHTLILWNGIPIHSPMLGQLDLSLLPTLQWERLTVQQGGGTAHWGSGAIGSLVHLDNLPLPQDSTLARLQVTAGAFGQQRVAAQLQRRVGRWEAHTKVQAHRSDNDFSYRPHPTLAPVRQAHAAQVGYQLAQSLYYSPDQRQQWAAHVWLQSQDRQLPATLTQTRSLATQYDAAWRSMLHWRYTGDVWLWAAKAAYLREQIDYRDPAIRLQALSGFDQTVIDATGQRYGQRGWHWQVGTTHTRTRAHTENYAQPTTELRSSVFATMRQTLPRGGWEASIRQGWSVDPSGGQWLPLVPQLSGRMQVGSRGTIQAQVGRHFRLPTLNDRFWSPGGNPLLRPESGWSEELTTTWGIRRKAWQYKVQATAYHRLIENWILWSPAENAGFWEATNLNRVRSAGLQTQATVAWEGRQGYRVAWEGRYDFTDTHNMEAVAMPRIAVGQPLYYTPRHQLQASLSANVGAWRIRYVHDWVGASLGVQAEVAPYHVGRAELSFAAASGGWTAWLHAENLWNTDYVVIENRPMPGRYWMLGWSIDLHKYN